MQLKFRVLLISLKIVLVLSAIDIAVATVGSFAGFSARSTFGDLLMFEAAVCFIVGGLLDFAKSAGAIGIRRVMFRARKFAEAEQGKANSREAAVVFMIAGFLLLVGTISLVIYDLTFH
jgi:hypothetical protein